jgi:hypothetical protein
MATWSDEQFCKRVIERLRELGVSQRQVLKEAGLAHDYLQNPPAHGRRLDRIVKLATALNWSLAEIMGLGLNTKVDVNLLTIAYNRTKQALGDAQDRDPKQFTNLQALIYNRLLARRADGLVVDDEKFLDGIVEIWAEQQAIERMRAA